MSAGTAELIEQRGTKDLDFPLHDTQRFAYESHATEQLYGGAMGGGKSHWIRVALIMWCLQIAGLQCYLFRRLYQDLRLNHMEGPQSFPVLLADSINSGLTTIRSHQITFYNGAKIFLCHLQYSANLIKYQGPEMHVLAFDELTHFEEKQYRFLRLRLRIPEAMKANIPEHLRGLFPRIISGSNPGNIGHNWVKRMFIGEKENRLEPLTIYEQPKSEARMFRQFIPARLEDNPSLETEEYEEKIAGIGDPVLERAYRSGDWDIVAGSMFGEAWRDETISHATLPDGKPWHVCEAFATPVDWKLWRGGDDGYSAPLAYYWVTQDPSDQTYYVIDEYYQTGVEPIEAAYKTKEKDQLIEITDQRGNVGHNVNILHGTLDAAAFTVTGVQEKITRGDQMNALGCQWERVEKFPGSRVARIQNFHRVMKPNAKARGLKPGIVFFRRCRNAIMTIKALMRDPDKVEDIVDGQEDHAFDGVTYALQYRRPLARRIKVGGI